MVGNWFYKHHTLYECNESSYFKDMDEDFENGDMNGANGSMNIHKYYQHNILSSLLNYNNSDDIFIFYFYNIFLEF